MITTISFDADGTLWDFPSVMQEALTVTDLQQTRDEVARTLRGNKVSLEYIRLKAFEQTLSNLGHNDPELASHLTTFYLEHRFPRDAQRVCAPHQRQKVSVPEGIRIVGKSCAHPTDPCHLA